MTDQPPGYNPPPPPGGYPPPPGGQQPPQYGEQPPPYGQQPGGYPPAPQGGYPPPPPGSHPQGGYPPPPPAGYPPPAAGYPGGPGWGYPPPYSIGEAFTWAWNKFSKNAGPLILAALAYGAILFVLAGLIVVPVMSMSQTTTTGYDDGFTSSLELGTGGITVLILGSIVMLVVFAVIYSAFLSGVLDIADGRPVTVGSFFRPRSVGPLVLATVLVGIATYIGWLACVIPGLIVSLFALFTNIAIVDRNLSAIDGIKASFNVVKDNLGPAILIGLLAYLLNMLGQLLCLVGLLVTAPLSLLLMVYTFRRLTGGQVAPQTP